MLWGRLASSPPADYKSALRLCRVQPINNILSGFILLAVDAAGRGGFAGWMACGAFYAASGMSALQGQRATRRHRAFGEARKLASSRLQVGAPPLPSTTN